ncbi:MAG: hypothetical protein KAS12_02530, partial [Candidatus Aenigmarchaeota archaeon]|nr:hypothetical protein [Candidatus Aenigmarchaeota archaeon]
KTEDKLYDLKVKLRQSIANAAEKLETQQLSNGAGKRVKKPSNGHQTSYILFLVLGISSIATLQTIESANSFKATGHFLTNESLVSSNVIFVLFALITGFLLGKHHK